MAMRDLNVWQRWQIAITLTLMSLLVKWLVLYLEMPLA
jgi:hypothetical protein